MSPPSGSAVTLCPSTLEHVHIQLSPPLSLKHPPPPPPTSGSFPPVCVGSLFFLAGGDGDQLLGGLGDVVGALDDLLGEQLVVHGGGPGLRGHRLTTLHLQPGSAGGQEAERAVDGVQSRPLQTDGAHRDRGQEAGYLKKYRREEKLTLGKRDAISETAEWIFSEHGTKLENHRTGSFMYSV